MKKVTQIVFSILFLSASSFCWGWTCPTGQIRQQAPAGTPTTTPYYDVVEGIAFICVPSNPTTLGATNSNTNTNSNVNSSNSTSNSNASSSSSATVNNNLSNRQKQDQQQSQTATGGNAASSATGGTALAYGNGDGSNNSTSNTVVEASKIPVSTAYAPSAMPTAPCFKGISGGVQTMAFGGSFGSGKVDQNCAILEAARSFGIAGSWLAYCKVMVTDKYAKAANISVEDCMQRYVPPAPAISVVRPTTPPQITVPVTINVPPIPLPILHEEVTVLAPKKRVVKHLPPDCQNVLQRVCKGGK